MASTNLSRTLSSGSATTKFTYSVWLKYSGFVSGGQRWFSAIGTGDTYFRFNEDGTMEISGDDSAATSLGYFITNRKFLDSSAWYHIVIKVDTAQVTNTDRFKLYINGVQETSFSTATYPNQSAADNINLSGNTQYIGGAASSQYFNGVMSHINYCDNYAYDASAFGETDSTTGQWKIKTDISVSYGTNGFFVLKDGNSGTDQSGENNNFAVANGTLTKTEDCPSNVFATFNPAYMPFATGNGRADNGGTTIGSPGGDSSSLASMGARSGKYYWEIRVQNAANTRSCGVVRSDLQGQSSTNPIYPGGNGNASNFTSAYNMVSGYVQTVTGGTQAQQGSLATLTTNDYLGVALDIDNLDIKWYKNDSLVTTTSLTSAWIENGLFIMPCNRLDGNQFVEYNFGNGCFGSTQLTGTTYPGEGGLGIFKYEPPSGFTALSTKGLNL